MTTEEKVLKIVKRFKGRVHSLQIAKELKISSGYVDFILKSLQRKEKIKFSGGWAFLLEEKVKETVKKEIPSPTKIKKGKPKRRRKKKAKKEEKKPKIKRKKRKKTETSIGLKGITSESEMILQKAGYKNKESLAKASLPRLIADTGIGLKQAANLINGARRSLKIIKNSSANSKKEVKKTREKTKRKNKLWPRNLLKRFFGRLRQN